MKPIDFFSYDPDTGALTWRQTRNGRGCVEGREAGSVTHGGRYRTVVVLGKRYYCHRLAWEIVNGPIPDGMCHVIYTKDFFEACCARKSAELANGYHPNHGRKI